MLAVAKMGLLGALAGVGDALQTAGTTLMQRREKALEDARRLAEYERKMADQKAAKQEEREFDLGKTAALEDRKDARVEFTTKARAAEKVEDRKFRATEKAEDRSHASELVKLRSSLARDNEVATAKLRDKLEGDDVRGIQYGAPNASGQSEVIVVTKSGGVRRTGMLVYRPAVDKDEEDEDEAL
jgi:hypothetical protein